MNPILKDGKVKSWDNEYGETITVRTTKRGIKVDHTDVGKNLTWIHGLHILFNPKKHPFPITLSWEELTFIHETVEEFIKEEQK